MKKVEAIGEKGETEKAKARIFSKKEGNGGSQKKGVIARGRKGGH